MEQETTLDRITPLWDIFQLRRGHRFSTDDMACAWVAAATRPRATRLLDLGSGIGSVGLMTLAKLERPEATLTGLEAQEISFELALRTRAHNHLEERVRFFHGDLRDPEALPAEERFDLITGSPPYVPEGHGVLSPNSQRAHCRIELRGSIFDYAAAARRWAAPGARFVFVMAAKDPRTEDAPVAAGWTVLERVDWVFRWEQGPHIAVLVCARDEDGPHPSRVNRQVVVRGPDGEWTDAYMAFRADMGPGR
ncbi:MAG: methyltransferase [Deltaproteobacteria bacterium]|nr:methyltransferase [Deltaproteobacteria bacterium]